MRFQARGHEVNGQFEGLLLRLAIVGPEVREDRFSALLMHDAEQIFEAAVVEGIAFHVEEQVALVWPRQSLKPSSRLEGQDFQRCGAAVTASDLQPGLGAQPLEGLCLKADGAGPPRRPAPAWRRSPAGVGYRAADG